MPLVEELRRGDGPQLRAFFRTFAPPGSDFARWVGVLRGSLERHDTLEGFACEFSLLAAGTPGGPAAGSPP